MNRNLKSSEPFVLTVRIEKQDSASEGASVCDGTGSQHLKEWMFHLISLYLVIVDVSIFSTTIRNIWEGLEDPNRISWIITSYMSAYTGFLIIWTKISDIFGRKTAMIWSSMIFLAFSGACGCAATKVQLITFRVFQGVGSAGMYSLTVLISYEMMPKARYAVFSAIMAVTISLATACGPLLGGLIAEKTTWRWAFNLNLPLDGIAIGLLAIALPNGFPHHQRRRNTEPKKHERRFCSLTKALLRLDVAGALLLLARTFCLIIALSEASLDYGWDSVTVLGLLDRSALSWVIFLIWEHYATCHPKAPEPVFPFRFLSNRPWMGMLLVSFTVGFPFNVLVITLPQRFQLVLHSSPLEAGVRLLPYVLTASLGAAAANVVCSRTKVPFIALIAFGAAVQVVGLALLATLTDKPDQFPTKGYVDVAMCGLGVGVTFGIIILATPFVADAHDLSVATGAVFQFRFLRGAIGLAIASCISNSYVKSHLDDVLTAQQLRDLLQDIRTVFALRPEIQEKVIQAFINVYNIQLKMLLYVTVVQVLASLLIWKSGSQFRHTD